MSRNFWGEKNWLDSRPLKITQLGSGGKICKKKLYEIIKDSKETIKDYKILP
jgi:hypothetical protein